MAYGDVTELARRLKISTPTAAQTEAMQLCLDEAAEEIDWALSGTPAWSPPPASPPYPAVVVNVSYKRALEHWQAGLNAFGAIPTGPDVVPVFAARDSFYRHRLELLPLKGQGAVAGDRVFGIA
jgi:hypothetical protein